VPGLRRGKQELAAGTLTPLILVRIQVPQPRILPISPHIFGIGNRWNSAIPASRRAEGQTS
jgi:hypothetical protein